MLKELGKKLRSNLGLKLLSLVIAILIWYVVVDNNDPVETAQYSVRITVENESYIRNGTQDYRIDDAYKTVTVYIKANRSKLKNITSDDITVTADLTQIVDLDSDPVMVPLTASCSGISQTAITLSRTAIPITIESISSKEFPVTVSTGDSSPGSDYEVGTTTANPESVIINGPESIVDSIDSVIAEIDVTGMTADGTKQATLKILDKNSEELSDETIEDDLTFDGGVPDVSVYVDLWKKQSDVSLEVNYSGEPASGYQVTNVSTTPETITVVGTDSALAELEDNGNVISIPEDLISVDGATTDVSVTIEMDDIMPDDIRPASTMADTLTVTLTILPDEGKELNLPVEDITTNNLDSSLTVSYDQTTLAVRVSGDSEDLSDLKTSDIEASIDLSGKGEGDYTVDVQVTLPDGITLLDDELTIQVHLKKKAES